MAQKAATAAAFTPLSRAHAFSPLSRLRVPLSNPAQASDEKGAVVDLLRDAYTFINLYE
jgi:hypothetical protein